MHTQDSGGLGMSQGHRVAAPALFLWNHRDSGEEKRREAPANIERSSFGSRMGGGGAQGRATLQAKKLTSS